jgi:hypothetical protein
MSGGRKGFQSGFIAHVPDCYSHLFDGRADRPFPFRTREARAIPQTTKEIFGMVIPKYAWTFQFISASLYQHARSAHPPFPLGSGRGSEEGGVGGLKRTFLIENSYGSDIRNLSLS